MILVEGLSFAYGTVSVFNEFAFSSNAKIVVFRGPNGSGKTTLLKLLSGNLSPDAFTTMPRPLTACMILQEDALFPWLSGTGNFQAVLGRNSKQFSELHKHPLFELIRPFVDRLACEMSYGQRRLIELIRAFLAKPALLCLDEPLNYLDAISRERITSFFSSAEMSNTTIVMSSHYSEDLSSIPAEEFVFPGTFPIGHIRQVRDEE